MKKIKDYTIQEIEELSDKYNTLVESDYRIGTTAMICLIRDAVVDQNLSSPYFEIPIHKTISGDIDIFILDWGEELVMNKNITSKEDTISIASGYEIEDIQGNRAKVCYIDYVSRIVVIVQDGRGHNLFFHEICRDWFRVLEDTAENFNSIEYTKASISLVIGDIIVDSAGTRYTVIYIDYRDLIVTISQQGNNFNITFDTASSGGYRKVMGISNPYLD